MDIVVLPFRALWRLVTLIFELTGRVLAMIIGLVLMILGGLISATVVGALIGIPMAVFGLLLVARGLF